MNDVLRISRLKIALQRAFLGRAILIFTMMMMVIKMMTVVLVENVDYELLTISFPRSSEFEEEEGDLVIDESMVGDLVKNIQTIDMMSSQI